MICPYCGKDNKERQDWCCWCGQLFERWEDDDLSLNDFELETPSVEQPESQSRRRERRSAEEKMPSHRTSTRRNKSKVPTMLAAVLIFVLLGAGGFFAYRHFFAPVSTTIPKVSNNYAQTASTNPPASEPVRVTSSNYDSWSSAYWDYISNQKYLSVTNLDFYNPMFAIYDLDKNGVSELIIFNGSDIYATKGYYVFSFENNQIVYSGSIYSRDGDIFYYNDSRAPGLFVRDTQSGETWTNYFYLQNHEITEEQISENNSQITTNSDLYNLSLGSDGLYYLLFFTREDMIQWGWNLSLQFFSDPDFFYSYFSLEDEEPLGDEEYIQGTLVQMSADQQYAVNIFLSNFSEQRAFEPGGYNAPEWSIDSLINFAYLYCRINRPSVVTTQGDYFTLPMATVNEVLDRHFGYGLNWGECEQYAGYGTFQNGTFFFPAASGDSYNRLTVASLMEQLPDGSYRVSFDIYALDLNEYFNSGIAWSYYQLTADQAQQTPNLTWAASGEAVITSYVYNDRQTYQLQRYQVW